MTKKEFAFVMKEMGKHHKETTALNAENAALKEEISKLKSEKALLARSLAAYAYQYQPRRREIQVNIVEDLINDITPVGMYIDRNPTGEAVLVLKYKHGDDF